jgi:hypothetical protein
MRSASVRPGSWTSAGAALLLLLLAAGAVATGLGAARYPGGSWVDPGAPGHSLWGNFLCDIARTMAVNGRPNPGAAWGRAAEWSFVAALWLFWWIVPALLDGRRLRWPVRALGSLGTLGLVLVPVTAGGAHALALVTGAGPGFVAAALVLGGLRSRPWLALAGTIALLLAALELALYLRFREGPLPIGVPAMQRVALLAAVVWMGACALALLQPQEAETAGASSTGSPRAT